jgi:diguanylate cyclase (GGDEF)-like protein
MNLLTLSFRDRIQEQEFLSDYEHHFRLTFRIALTIGILFYAFFGALDVYLYPLLHTDLWLVRYGLVMPVLVLAAIYLFRAGRHTRTQEVLTLATLVAGLGVVAMTVIIPAWARNTYFAGLIIVMMFVYTFLRMRFVWACISSWLVVVAYEVASLEFGSVEVRHLVADNFFLISANFVGMAACYSMEYDARRRFILMRELHSERKRISNVNVELESLNTMLDRLAHHDDLTGIPNRRSFFAHLTEEWNRHRRFKASMSLVLIDVDYFKRYNDTYGHQAGDECLKQLASLMLEFTNRAGDQAARIGGEEFVLFLAGTDLAEACELGKKLRRKVEKMNIPHTGSLVADYVTISAGVATTVPGENLDAEDLLKQADNALYEAKEAGRNQVVCHTLE